MRKTALISLLVPVLLVTVGCSIEPPLHMRKTAQTQVVMQTNINTDVMWQANWQSEWDFAWNAAAHGPVGYSAPTGIRMHIFTLGPAGTPVQHHVYNFNGLSGSAEIFLGVHDFLIHNNGSEYVLFRANDDLSDIYAYTRTLSTAGLKSSIPIRTVSQTASPVSPTAPVATRTEEDDEGEDAATRDEDEDPVEEINEPVVLAPDDLYVMYDPAHLISDDLSQYDLIDGTYVLRISGDMHPTTYIYLFQMRLINN